MTVTYEIEADYDPSGLPVYLIECDGIHFTSRRTRADADRELQRVIVKMHPRPERHRPPFPGQAAN